MGVTTHRKSSYEEGSLDQYLRDISIYPLISRDEEVRLAQRIRANDQEALDKLVRSNLRFVVSVAKKYQNQGVSLSDLINEGNLGLIRAAHKFDETKGIKFISYAVWWIRQAILQALAEQSRIVRVPLNRAGTLHRIGKRANALLQELGREPTHEEIADGMDITEEEVRLAQRIRVNDQEALDKLVRSNLRFVVSVAKKYQNQGVSLSDLINEGNLGLIRAAHKFDETKGIKFISYAVWWIRQAILQALAEQSRIVRVPLNRAGTLHRIGKRANTLLQELGREATHEEIAEGMDITEEEVAKTMSISQTHLSLDAPLAPGEDNKLLDYLPDNLNPTPDEQTFEKALTESIEEALSHLKEREAKILRLYFGLDGTEPMTLEEIGSLLGITRERVRQIKEKALSRLRHVSRARALESYLG